MSLDDKITALEQQHARWRKHHGLGEVINLDRYRRQQYEKRVEQALAEANAELDKLERIIGRPQV